MLIILPSSADEFSADTDSLDESAAFCPNVDSLDELAEFPHPANISAAVAAAINAEINFFFIVKFSFCI
jgi:hypothetical protein